MPLLWPRVALELSPLSLAQYIPLLLMPLGLRSRVLRGKRLVTDLGMFLTASRIQLFDFPPKVSVLLLTYDMFLTILRIQLLDFLPQVTVLLLT